MALCKIGTCENDGAYSCNSCGRLFCGRHGQVTTFTTFQAECADCHNKVQQRLKKEGRIGCTAALVLLVVGVILATIAVNTSPTNLFAAFGSGIAILAAIALVVIS